MLRILVVVAIWIALASCSDHEEQAIRKQDPRKEHRRLVVQYIYDGATRIVMPSGQSVTIYGSDNIGGVEVDLHLPHDSTMDGRGFFLTPSDKVGEMGSLIVGDSQGAGEYRIVSAKAMKRLTYRTKEELHKLVSEGPLIMGLY